MPRYGSVLLTIPLSLTAQVNTLTPIASTRYDHGLPAKSDAGDASISAREMLVDVTYNGKPRKAALLILFDQLSGRYLWEFGPVGQNEKTSTHTRDYGTVGLAHIAGDRLVHFAYGPPLLMAHESTTIAAGIDDAQAKALNEATARIPAKFTHQTDDRTIINLGKFLPHEFFLACAVCSGPAPAKLLDIVHKGNTWELTLQGQWQEKITLDDKYNVTATLRIN